MLDRITGMQVFSRSAHAGSISAAARQMGLSPGMATKHLDALEGRLGVRLFHRSTRKLTLTESGQQYLELCTRLLPELDEVEALIASQRLAVGTAARDCRRALPDRDASSLRIPGGGSPLRQSSDRH
jgi:DNA-binding transcriptional LysR family regulator